MSPVLFCLIGLTWLVALRCYGPFSYVTAGVFCFTVYSLPALFGLVYPFDSATVRISLREASEAAVNATVLAWAVFIVILAMPVAGRRVCVLPGTSSAAANSAAPDLSAFITACLLLCIGGFLLISATDGPLFFLEMREEGSEGLLRMLWRWVNVIGLLAAVRACAWRAALVFGCAVLVYFLSGDRTIVVISAVCLLVVWGRGRSLAIFFRPTLIIGLTVLLVVAVFGKPIYLAVKLGSIELLAKAAGGDGWLDRAALAFEPFTTFNILEVTIRQDFRMSMWKLFEGALGQLLLVPSFFGVDANSFNVEFTQTFVPRLRYGIAGNYWAQGWAIAGALGVCVYAVLYASGLRLCDRVARRYSGAMPIFFSVIGGLLAVYAHRNAFDNLLSFVRQIAIVFALLFLIVKIIEPFVHPKPCFEPKRGTPDCDSGTGTQLMREGEP